MASRVVYSCDRCNAEYGSGESGQIGVMVGAANECYYDLCPSCMDEINEWLRGLRGPMFEPLGYEEICPHKVPCVVCPDPVLRRKRA